ncbi:hypothetical protein RB195_005795 [Necator americanus]|uniref:Uncharacterized protein n=1 Tax=Necator americanus TaxID=51031 RepID=A0ABR1BPL2_NECAM
MSALGVELSSAMNRFCIVFLLAYVQWCNASYHGNGNGNNHGHNHNHNHNGYGHEFPVAHIHAIAAAAPLYYAYAFPFSYGLIPFKNRKKAAHKRKNTRKQ